MKAIAAILSLAAVSGFLVLRDGAGPQPRGADHPLAAGSAAGGRSLLIAGLGENCRATADARTRSRPATLHVEPSCAGVFPSLARAVAWVERDDGSVVLSDRSGRPVLMLAPGDGVDYESVAPQSAFVSVSVLDG